MLLRAKKIPKPRCLSVHRPAEAIYLKFKEIGDSAEVPDKVGYGILDQWGEYLEEVKAPKEKAAPSPQTKMADKAPKNKSL